jgi:two-component system sensor histidine kinase KdpD
MTDALTTGRGRLKVFLGYAAGVGKTFQMLTEAQELREKGVDLVIGYFEPHARKDTMALTQGLETVPRKVVEYRGARIEEMDADAIVQRRPAVAIVDEFPHTNVPGSGREKRWEDVHALLDTGINVLTTMNVQHLESLNDQIWQSTGVRVRETIPDWVLQQADEVVMVDLTPRALINRLRRGVVYSPEKAQQALENFFREPTLVALRELALRQTAYAVESRQPADTLGASNQPAREPIRAADRLLLLIEPDPSSAALIRRGRRVADYLQADCIAVYVATHSDLRDLEPDQRDTLERQLNFARALQIDTRILEGKDAAATLVNFARMNGVTQIFVTRHTDDRLASVFRRGLVQRIVGFAPDMQVTIVADRSNQRPIM